MSQLILIQNESLDQSQADIFVLNEIENPNEEVLQKLIGKLFVNQDERIADNCIIMNEVI